jgi:hypothetical protein
MSPQSGPGVKVDKWTNVVTDRTVKSFLGGVQRGVQRGIDTTDDHFAA